MVLLKSTDSELLGTLFDVVRELVGADEADDAYIVDGEYGGQIVLRANVHVGRVVIGDYFSVLHGERVAVGGDVGGSVVADPVVGGVVEILDGEHAFALEEGGAEET